MCLNSDSACFLNGGSIFEWKKCTFLFEVKHPLSLLKEVVAYGLKQRRSLARSLAVLSVAGEQGIAAGGASSHFFETADQRSHYCNIKRI